MKDIKYFKYKNTFAYNVFLKECGYILDDVEGFSVVGQKWYHGNILKVYCIWFKDCHEEYFKVVYFKSLNECDKARLGFNGNKLLKWYDDANVVWYKVKDIYGMHDRYVITAK